MKRFRIADQWALVAVLVCSSGWSASLVAAPSVRFAATEHRLGGGKAAWGDFDNDGYVDVIAGAKVWRNEKGAKFTSVASIAGDGAIWGDFDNDGYLDIFSYAARRLYRNEGGKSFQDVSSRLPDFPMEVTRGAVWGDFNGDGFLDLYVGGYEAPGYQPDTILISEAGKKFVITWQQSGDVDPSRGITAADFDEDGDLDVYVSNYRLEHNQLWRNDGKGKFVNAGKTHGVAGTDDGWTYSYGHTIGSAWGDMDSDGRIDLFVGNFSHPPAWQDRPRFYRNLGKASDYRFEDKSQGAGLAWQESFASPALADANNDGYLDLYFTAVYAGNHGVLYLNQGKFKFVDVTDASGIKKQTTYQAAWADFDNDGDQDLMTAGTLYRNLGAKGSWLKVRLGGDGVRVNRAAIGTQVRAQVGDLVITRQVEAGTGEGNQNELTLHFGIGDFEGDIPLEIRWPDGTVGETSGKPNQTLVVEFVPPPSSKAEDRSTTSAYDLQLDIVRRGWDGKKCWVHSRAGVIPPRTKANPGEVPIVVMTTQKQLVTGNDIFDGLHDLRTDDLGKTWEGPRAHETLSRRRMGEKLEAAPCDFTPRWHAKTGTLLGTGKTFWYRDNGQYREAPSDTIYAVYDPAARSWSAWRKLEYPDLPQFKNVSAGCTQRYDLPGGDVLLPVYFRPKLDDLQHRATVVRCKYDGKTLSYVEHGDELVNPDKRGRGYSEPSLTRYRGRFYLTLRSDTSAHVTVGKDGLHFDEVRPWRFDDGKELGSYNTQQHWVTHSGGLYLVYTRRGAKNDHVFRHRAPLFMARVDTDRLMVLRATERVLVPEKGTRIGNFGVVDVSPEETWVITTEWMQQPPPGGFAEYGSDNRIYVARVRWRERNELGR